MTANETPTPRTDAEANGSWRVFDEEGHEVSDPMLVWADFARQLERELNATEQRLAALEEQVAMLRGFLNI